MWWETICGRFASDDDRRLSGNFAAGIRLMPIQTEPFVSQLHKADYVSVGIAIHHGRAVWATIVSCMKHVPHVSRSLTGNDYPSTSFTTSFIVFSRVGSVDRRALIKES